MNGIDVLLRSPDTLPVGTCVAVLTNKSARTHDGIWVGDALKEAGYEISVYLGPEHGLEGAASAGETVAHATVDTVPVLSLYGADPTPVRTALRDVDAVLVDLPDVGCRYYTYPWTVRQVLEFAQEAGKPVLLLDRPNPLGGLIAEGPLPERGWESIVCPAHVPIRHALTLGELARQMARSAGMRLDLNIVPAAGWRRAMVWQDTGLNWTPPSPALRTWEAAVLYPGTCLLEGTTVSEGRGTEAPFAVIGAPFVDAEALIAAVETSPGVSAAPDKFIPSTSKWAGETCQGIRLSVDDPSQVRPVTFGVTLLCALRTLPGFEFRDKHFDALAGGPTLRSRIEAGAEAAEIVRSWQQVQATFTEGRRAILLYD